MEKKHVSAYIAKISVATSQRLAKGVVHIFEIGYIFNHLLFKLFSCILWFSGRCTNYDIHKWHFDIRL